MKNTLLLLCGLAVLLSGCAKDKKKEVPQYSVTVMAGDNGTASADKVKAEAGVTITITATPADGFEFSEWVVTGDNVSLTPNATTSPATFTMPAANVSAKAEFTYAGVTINGVTWSEFNVDEPGKFTAKVTDYGMFYQWGRKTAWLSTGSNPVSSPSGTSWTAVPDGTDSDVWAPANDPCPAGWRIPNKAEQATLFEVDKVTVGVFEPMNGVNGLKFTDNTTNKSIFFPAAGRRNYNTGKLSEAGDYAYYWSGSTSSKLVAGSLYFSSDNGSTSQIDSNRSSGFPVRCVRDE